MSNGTITGKDLSGITDMLTYEQSACKKCTMYAQSFTDPELQQFAEKLAEKHYKRFSAILKFLDGQN